MVESHLHVRVRDSPVDDVRSLVREQQGALGSCEVVAELVHHGRRRALEPAALFELGIVRRIETLRLESARCHASPRLDDLRAHLTSAFGAGEEAAQGLPKVPF
jgi:hypothetical protein